MLPLNGRNGPQIVANVEIAGGYPVAQFQEPGNFADSVRIATFSTVRPSSAPKGETPTMFLRLYCAARLRTVEAEVFWQIRWRWVQAVGPSVVAEPYNEPNGIRPNGPDGSDETTLISLAENDGFGEAELPVIMFSDDKRLHLHVSEPLELEPTASPADYLVVYLTPAAGGAFPVYLLAAELRWVV